MRSQLNFERVCAWSGILCAAMFFAAFVLAGFVPPLSPALSPAEVAEHYRTHTSGIRIGAGIMLISGMFYAAFTGVISAQMRRIPGVHPAVVYVQLVAGAFGCVTFLLPAMLFAATAFRPERSADMTQLLNDLSWIILVMPWPPFMTQNFAFAFAILSDPRETPLFPRWLAYVNVWAPILFTPALALPFFKTGPLAWSGIFVIWIPAFVFIAQFIANTTRLLAAIHVEQRELWETSQRTLEAST
jgi:hypothetical protein